MENIMEQSTGTTDETINETIKNKKRSKRTHKETQIDTSETDGTSTASDYLDKKGKKGIRTTKVAKKEQERELYTIFKHIRNKKKLDTLRRAITPKTEQKNIRHSKETDKEEELSREPPENAYDRAITTLSAQLKVCDDPETYDATQSAISFYHTVFNNWQQAHSITKLHIERELAHSGIPRAKEKGIKHFFIPTHQGVIDSVSRYFTQQYHAAIAFGPLALYDQNDNRFVVAKTIQEFYDMSRVNKIEKKIQKEDAISVPTGMDDMSALCVSCNVIMIYDNQHGESVCSKCGVVSRGISGHEQTFQEQQQSSTRCAAPYERIAHVSLFDVYIYYFNIIYSFTAHKIPHEGPHGGPHGRSHGRSRVVPGCSRAATTALVGQKS